MHLWMRVMCQLGFISCNWGGMLIVGETIWIKGVGIWELCLYPLFCCYLKLFLKNKAYLENKFRERNQLCKEQNLTNLTSKIQLTTFEIATLQQALFSTLYVYCSIILLMGKTFKGLFKIIVVVSKYLLQYFPPHGD